MVDRLEHPGNENLNRRQALRRLGQGVAGGAAFGAAAWLTPEILIGRPTAAGASSAAPGNGPVGGAGGSETTQGSGVTPGQSADPVSPVGQSGGTGGGQLAFTGSNLGRDVELGAALLVGGWVLTRWSGGKEQDQAHDPAAGQDRQVP